MKEQFEAIAIKEFGDGHFVLHPNIKKAIIKCMQSAYNLSQPAVTGLDLMHEIKTNFSVFEEVFKDKDVREFYYSLIQTFVTEWQSEQVHPNQAELIQLANEAYVKYCSATCNIQFKDFEQEMAFEDFRVCYTQLIHELGKNERVQGCVDIEKMQSEMDDMAYNIEQFVSQRAEQDLEINTFKKALTEIAQCSYSGDYLKDLLDMKRTASDALLPTPPKSKEK